MENAQDVYSRTVSHLPEPERLRLATLILEELKWPDSVRQKESDSETPALGRAQDYVRSLVPEGRDLVSELIADRRDEARREMV